MQSDNYYNFRTLPAALTFSGGQKAKGFQTRMVELPRTNPTWKYRIYFWGLPDGKQDNAAEEAQAAARVPKTPKAWYGPFKVERDQPQRH